MNFSPKLEILINEIQSNDELDESYISDCIDFHVKTVRYITKLPSSLEFPLITSNEETSSINNQYLQQVVQEIKTSYRLK